MSMLYYALLFCLFLAVLLIVLNMSMLMLGDVFGVMLWIVGVSILLMSMFDDGEY